MAKQLGKPVQLTARLFGKDFALPLVLIRLSPIENWTQKGVKLICVVAGYGCEDVPSLSDRFARRRVFRQPRFRRRTAEEETDDSRGLPRMMNHNRIEPDFARRR